MFLQFKELFYMSMLSQICYLLFWIFTFYFSTVEDTDTTFEEIESIFGKEVADVVREVTDDKNLNKAERKKQQVEHAKHASYQAKLIKLCDKLYNCRDIQKQPPSFW